MSKKNEPVYKVNPLRTFAAMLTHHKPYKVSGCGRCESYEKDLNKKGIKKDYKELILEGWRGHHALNHIDKFVEDNSKKTFKDIGIEPKKMRKKRKVESESESSEESESAQLRESDYETDTDEGIEVSSEDTDEGIENSTESEKSE